MEAIILKCLKYDYYIVVIILHIMASLFIFFYKNTRALYKTTLKTTARATNPKYFPPKAPTDFAMIVHMVKYAISASQKPFTPKTAPIAIAETCAGNKSRI